MSMTEKDFVALADVIAHNNGYANEDMGSHPQSLVPEPFSYAQILVLADFCQKQNPQFSVEGWLKHIAIKEPDKIQVSQIKPKE